MKHDASAANPLVISRIAAHVDAFEQRLPVKDVSLQHLVTKRLLGSCVQEPQKGLCVKETARDQTGHAGEMASNDAFTDVSCTIRGFLSHRGWHFCRIRTWCESPLSLLEDVPIDLNNCATGSGWQHIRSVCARDDAVIGGFVCGHFHSHRSVRVRIVTVDVVSQLCNEGQQSDCGRGSSSRRNQDEMPAVCSVDWIIPPSKGDGGFFGALHQDNFDQLLLDDPGDHSDLCDLLPIGTRVRARCLRTDVDQRLLSDLTSHCSLSLRNVFVGPCRASAMFSLGALANVATDTPFEWSAGGLDKSWEMDLSLSDRFGVASRARLLGLQFDRALCGLSIPSHCSTCCNGARESLEQGRCWANQRVREGIACAKSGDLAAALARYQAALELCPDHKDGLVAKGAALCKIGRIPEALADFDRALELNPNDRNALHYREITQRRLQDGRVTGLKRKHVQVSSPS